MQVVAVSHPCQLEALPTAAALLSPPQPRLQPDGTTAPGAPAPARQRIEKLSGEVVDSNPYSRLMALQRMGIVKDYEKIRQKTVGGWLGVLLCCAVLGQEGGMGCG